MPPVSKIIYGTIIIPVVIVAVEDHPPAPAGTVATALFTGPGGLADMASYTDEGYGYRSRIPG